VRTRSSELERKSRSGTSIVRYDTENELDLLGNRRTLAHFLGVVKGHHVDSRAKGLHDVSTRLAGVGEYDVGLLRKVLSQLADEPNLLARGAIEVGA
jgi:hypothetical protein